MLVPCVLCHPCVCQFGYCDKPKNYVDLICLFDSPNAYGYFWNGIKLFHFHHWHIILVLKNRMPYMCSINSLPMNLCHLSWLWWINCQFAKNWCDKATSYFWVELMVCVRSIARILSHWSVSTMYGRQYLVLILLETLIFGEWYMPSNVLWAKYMYHQVSNQFCNWCTTVLWMCLWWQCRFLHCFLLNNVKWIQNLSYGIRNVIKLNVLYVLLSGYLLVTPWHTSLVFVRRSSNSFTLSIINFFGLSGCVMCDTSIIWA